MTIENIDISDLARIVADLVRSGVTFRASPAMNGTWTIALTGGY